MEAGDLAVIKLVKAGDRDAFRVLVERHSRTVFRLAFRLTQNEQDAEEVVQETFLRAYKSIATFESRANFSTWLCRIGINCALNLMALRKPVQPLSGTDDEGEDFEIQVASNDPGPERQLLSGEVRERVSKAMSQLTTVERTAFVMRHFEGRSIEEISNVLDIRAGAAKHTIFRAVQKLRRVLEPLGDFA